MIVIIFWVITIIFYFSITMETATALGCVFLPPNSTFSPHFMIAIISVYDYNHFISDYNHFLRD